MGKLDKEPRNNKGLLHGYTEWYDEGELWLRCMFKNNQEVGYLEHHRKYSEPDTIFYIR